MGPFGLLRRVCRGVWDLLGCYVGSVGVFGTFWAVTSGLSGCLGPLGCYVGSVGVFGTFGAVTSGLSGCLGPFGPLRRVCRGVWDLLGCYVGSVGVFGTFWAVTSGLSGYLGPMPLRRVCRGVSDLSGRTATVEPHPESLWGCMTIGSAPSLAERACRAGPRRVGSDARRRRADRLATCACSSPGGPGISDPTQSSP
jgi:hypothetical protein